MLYRDDFQIEHGGHYVYGNRFTVEKVYYVTDESKLCKGEEIDISKPIEERPGVVDVTGVVFLAEK